ncbi:serine/threonine kinase [Ordospora pajunii]|uniref:serine/threonine kinase n=1 Tax=Ordospora pajunii TaxID=3039483 RepID=UPI0029525ED2|nr:serine/threonine kinase [Ordospora pajunii]KAH9411925.1 serine/threonine kinase [Ordospora pajunii]
MLKVKDFRIGRVLGVGAFGKVHLATINDNPELMFAVKILCFRKLLTQRLIDQLESEVSILRQLYGCAFVAKLFATDFDNGKVKLIMEYVSGGELFYWLKKCGRFNEKMARFYSAEIICALRYIHNKGILYRDLKPENILIASNGHIKLVDFGFATYEHENIYMISGTPEYMSPEKLGSEEDGRASDYWGLGIILYEMICGDPPFYDESAEIVYHKILESQAVFPHYVSPLARSLITGLLNKNRANRLGARGIHEITEHPFFEEINWDDAENRRMEPPFIPRLCKNIISDVCSHQEENSSEDEGSVFRPYKHIKAMQPSKSNQFKGLE